MMNWRDLQYILKDFVVRSLLPVRLLALLVGYLVDFVSWWQLNILGNPFNSFSIRCRFLRYLSLGGGDLYRYFFSRWVEKFWTNISSENQRKNIILSSFSQTMVAKAFRKEFVQYGQSNELRLRYPKKNDLPQRQGDLLVLKPFVGPQEKGVLFIQYNDSFKKLAAIYDIERLAEKYRFVLEPSTWGYQDVVFMLFNGLPTDVVVEAQYAPDYDYINSLQSNLVPIRLGAGDWVDFNLFKKIPDEEKLFDLIMVASWQKLKRHDLLFQALSKIKNKIGKIALVGYPAGGRSLCDVQKDAMGYDVHRLIDYFEQIPPSKVAKLVSQSRASIMLSKREGANKGIYESFFCDVPVILTSENVGVNREHINDSTGVLAPDSNLSESILEILQDHKQFSPREWAITHTGYVESTKKMNAFLQKKAVGCGEIWTNDIFFKKNCTNAMYVYEHDRLIADLEFEKLEHFVRR
ncbi:MAG: glycosyltransferase [Desulforhopalus sp.]